MNPMMNSTLIAVLSVVAAVQGGSAVIHRRSASRQSAPSLGGPRNTDISLDGESIAVGVGYTGAGQTATMHVEGSVLTPAQLAASSGSDVGLYQDAFNQHLSVININADGGSSSASQANSAANSAYAYDYLGVGAQGDLLELLNNGWSSVQGVGVVEQQVDALQHTSDVSGWFAPPTVPSPGTGLSGPPLSVNTVWRKEEKAIQ